MAVHETLKDIYIDELRDLWSANYQMRRFLPNFAEVASEDLADMLEDAIAGIGKHTDILKSLIEDNGGELSKDHCRGMEGLVKEAQTHVLNNDLANQEVRDVVIVAQYQRMCHYGLAGFGTAAAYAKVLSLDDDEVALKKAVKQIYKGDEAASHLAKKALKLAAKHEDGEEDDGTEGDENES